MEKSKPSVFVRDGEETTRQEEVTPLLKREKMRRFLVYLLMGAACVGCLFLIFKPKESSTDIADAGLNKSVPQAEDAILQGDKEKAYEQELLERKENDRKKAMLSLSDYLDDSNDVSNNVQDHQEVEDYMTPASQGARNYREIQQTLGSFYESDAEKDALRRELKELKAQKRDYEAVSQSSPNTDPLIMMEKSYQMAAKYLPQMMPQKPPADTVKKTVTAERYVEPVYTAKKDVVSSLYREKEHSSEELLETMLNTKSKRLFNGQETKASSSKQFVRNSIRACVHQTQTVNVGSSVSLRLLEAARIAKMTIPEGTLLTAAAMVRDGRLALLITSVEYKGNIVPVDLSAYDLDGQQGLNLPYSPESNAIKEIASGMSTSAGTNIVLSSSTGQQLISDLAKGVVQGTSGYLSKRIGNPRVTVKAGHLLYLLPKK